MLNSESVFSRRCAELLRAFLGSSRCLAAFDFDGTLAPIVATPAEARMEARVASALGSLSQEMPTLVISGRSVADLRHRVPPEVVFLLGNHGLEGSSLVDAEGLEKARALTRGWLEVLRNRLAPNGHFFVEDKTYSISIHFRKAFLQRPSRLRALREAHALTPAPVLLDGKSVVNLLPPGLPDKYVALKGLMAEEGFSRAIFVGDDVTDNQVFRARDSSILSVKVGLDRSLLAPWHLERQSDMGRFLDFLRESFLDLR